MGGRSVILLREIRGWETINEGVNPSGVCVCVCVSVCVCACV